MRIPLTHQGHGLELGLLGGEGEKRRAVKQVGGDAFFKLTTEEEATGFPLVFSVRKVRVTGKVLKIEDLGTVFDLNCLNKM